MGSYIPAITVVSTVDVADVVLTEGTTAIATDDEPSLTVVG